ncbi:hypothetical protein OZY38_10610, partial [Aliarcobacter cryaerophilus]|uniref:hypothetical protein n=1 Tax=Aliarcobacter cryaerophilus TaxID=28198 RepID=UPI003BAF2EBF
NATVTKLDTTGTGKVFEKVELGATATVTVNDTNAIDTTTVTIEPIVTTSNNIDMTHINNTASGYEVKAYSSYTDDTNKTEGIISTVGDATAFGNAVRGFGVKGDDASNGDERELGKGEAIVIDFKAKDILSVDVSLAWRNQAEKADITFLDKNGNKVGSASLTGGKNGNLEATSTITYKDASGNKIGDSIKIQGGSDGIDKPFELKLPNGQLFNKVVFTAPDTNDDYLINSIQYKEVVVDNSSSVITGNGEVVFKISTSNIPDPSKYDDANPPKAIVEIQISGSSEIITKEVTLDREGKGTVLVQADGTKTITAEVIKIIGGNFEAVDYSSAKSTITVGTTNPTASNDKIDVVEDTAYTLQITDFGNTQTDVAEIQFKELPSIDSGKLYILNSLVTSSTNERAEYTQNDSGKVFVAVKAGDIVDISQIENGNVIFVPKENSDVDGSFKFIVGDGNVKWSDDSTPYKTEIIVKAVADAPTVSIDITKIGATIISTGNTNGGNSGTSSSFDKLIKQTATGKDGNLEQDIQQSNSNQNIEKDYQNVNANNITTGLGNDTLKFQALNNKTITTGEGNDKVIIDNGSNNNQINVGNGNNEISITHSLNQGSITAGSGNDTLFVGNAADGSTINMGAGNDKVQIDGDFKSKVYLGAGDDKIALYSPHTNFEADGRSYIDGGNGFDTLYVENLNSSDFKVKIKSTGEEITWEKYSELNNHKDGEANIEFVIHHKTNTNQGFVVKNIEQIVFKDKAFGEKDNSIKAVAYKVDISAALTDTDGSETLSVIIKNVPASATLESSKYEVSKNSDGSYTVKVPQGETSISDKLTMKVPQEDAKNINLQIEAKATEARDNEDGLNFKTSAANNFVVMTTDETSVLTVSNEATNIVLTLDVTTSMVYNDYRDGNHTSLHVLQKSAISTIEAYSSKGETNVNMTIFSKTAHNLGWMTSSEAIDYLNKLTQDENGNELRHWELNEKLETKLGITDVSTTNYKNAIAETVKVDFSGKSGNNVGYFISDGRPWDDASDTTREYYSIGKDYQDQASWDKWETFIKDNKIDFKAIGIGMPEDNKKAESFLQDIQFASGHKDIILIDEPTSMETIFLSTVDGTVSGDITDNIFGGDGKITIDSIEVNDIVYTRENMPKNGLQIDGEGKLLFDFETGKYAYNGNGIEITENKVKLFKVNVSDENEDKGSLDVNFELKAQPITDGLVKFEKGGDINLSNLENIVNLKEINLDNGKENKLSLTLDDVLKLSGDDGKIKITGDQFDSVAFKNEDGKAWEKGNSVTEDNKTFDVYSGSIGDQTVQVKVEQPISDGITN